MVRASTSKKTVKESSTGTAAKTTNVTKKTTARKTTKTSTASKAVTTKQRAPKSSSKQAPTKTKTSTRACTTSKKTTTKVKASPVVPPTPVVEEKPKQVRKTKATKSVENIATNLVWVNPATGLTSTAHYDPTKQIVECKLSIVMEKQIIPSLLVSHLVWSNSYYRQIIILPYLFFRNRSTVLTLNELTSKSF